MPDYPAGYPTQEPDVASFYLAPNSQLLTLQLVEQQNIEFLEIGACHVFTSKGNVQGRKHESLGRGVDYFDVAL